MPPLLSRFAGSLPTRNKIPAPPPGEAPKDPTRGIDATIKYFYESKNSSPLCRDWVDTPPKQISAKVARQQDRVALKLYKIIDYSKPVIKGRVSLAPFMLEVQNYTLLDALRPVLAKEGTYLADGDTATFHAPFQPLWFRRDDIKRISADAAAGSQLKIQTDLLLSLMAELFGSVGTQIKTLEAASLITYNLAWAFFPRGCDVYTPGPDCERIRRVKSTRYDRKNGALVLECEEVVFDGRKFAWSASEARVGIFTGNRPVRDLEHYPLSCHEAPDAVRKRLADRGTRALEFQGLAYAMYAGVATCDSMHGQERHNVEGRILVDVFGFKKHFLGLGRGETEKERENNEGDDWVRQEKRRLKELNREKKEPEKPYIHRLDEAAQAKNKADMLARPEDLVYVAPTLAGYALKNKQWLMFFLDDIKPMVWNDEAYDHLVYPEQQKDLILSFVENHRRPGTQVVQDVIVGKGQGLITLLSGPPGTGKTLMAEAVADRTRRPLFYLQAEDLGIVAAELGPKIKKVFELATDWDAVILLDEADVFMAERSPNDIVRNELVSIFLRELEYFSGIIFLTTNLYHTIDAAFRSRVNIHLLFSPLAPEARALVWRKFLERLPGGKSGGDSDSEATLAGMTEEDIKELAQWELNGREIKNAIHTVRTWCNVKGYEMTLARMESGIKVTAPQASKRGSGSQSLYD
ncbi:ATPase [Trichodelitschia bisporula]|uniref:ATPase n=1 Tax=Trichodelitschia bisporula TaxID=703511 RepID=A0A6G1HJN4_9PEZI|nr:ATPase [Trichodelitschia bisporula]